jgi:hypothetical protein
MLCGVNLCEQLYQPQVCAERQQHCRLIRKPLRRHGDAVARLADGYYRALGRVDYTLNVGGNTVCCCCRCASMLRSAVASVCKYLVGCLLPWW